MRTIRPLKGLRNSPLCVLNILKCNNGILRDAVCPGHSPKRVDAFCLRLADTKEYDIHLRLSDWITMLPRQCNLAPLHRQWYDDPSSDILGARDSTCLNCTPLGTLPTCPILLHRSFVSDK